MLELLQRDVGTFGNDLFDVFTVNGPPWHSSSRCRGSYFALLPPFLFHASHPRFAAIKPECHSPSSFTRIARRQHVTTHNFE
jgi:hypothetical protein